MLTNEDRSNLRKGIIWSVVVFVLAYIIISLTLSLIAIFALAAGDRAPGPLTGLYLIPLVGGPVLVLAITLIPARYFAKMSNPVGKVVVYYLILVIALSVTFAASMGYMSLSTQQNVERNIENISETHAMLLGKWETEYEGASIIVEFAPGRTTREGFLSNGGTVNFYANTGELIDTGGFTVSQSTGVQQPFLSISSLPLRSEDQPGISYYFWRQGKIEIDSSSRFRFHAEDIRQRSPDEGMVTVMTFTKSIE